jgi:hypothetical protein
MIAWNKTTSKIMHYNPCAVDFIAVSGGTTTPNFPPPPTVSVGLGGKKPAKVTPPTAPATVKEPEPTPTQPTKNTTTAKETTKAVEAKETKNEQPAKPQQRKFSFTNIKLSDLKR